MTLSLDELRTWSEGIARVVESLDDKETPRHLCNALGNLVQADRLGVFVLRRHSSPLAILHDVPPGADA
ncbi:MAG: hypothetical protein OES59_09585, partial [Gammaproteobacteria bacterium]|nr:hypothetical protein [Gammaproteobacteria bacterium]